VFKGETWLPRSDAVKSLMRIASVGRSCAYDALKFNGLFEELLREHPAHEDWIGLRQSATDQGEEDGG
jgi:hypothetical protein